MTHVIDLLSIERTRYCPVAESKKRALEIASQILAKAIPEADDRELFSAFIDRERLGSTAIGRGVAIPHIRSEWVKQPMGALLHLHEDIDFEASDHQKIDIIFALIVPAEATDEHLQILSQLAQLFSHPEITQQIRKSHDNRSLYQIIQHYHHEQQATLDSH